MPTKKKQIKRHKGKKKKEAEAKADLILDRELPATLRARAFLASIRELGDRNDTTRVEITRAIIDERLAAELSSDLPAARAAALHFYGVLERLRVEGRRAELQAAVAIYEADARTEAAKVQGEQLGLSMEDVCQIMAARK